MPRTLKPWERKTVSFQKLVAPLKTLKGITPLMPRGNRPLQITFEDQLHALIYFHLEDHASGRHLIQSLNEDDFAREYIAPEGGIQKSSFFEAVNTRGLEQLIQVFEALEVQTRETLPKEHAELGDLISVDGSLIDATLSMAWADYVKGSKEGKSTYGV